MSAPASPSPSWFEHMDLMQLILAALLMYVIWTFKRALIRFDESQSRTADTLVDLYEKVNAIDRRVIHVETVHVVRGCEKAASKGGEE